MPPGLSNEFDDFLVLATCAGVLLAATSLLWLAGWWASLRGAETEEQSPGNADRDRLFAAARMNSAADSLSSKAA